MLVHGHEASTVPVRDHSARCKSMPVDARGAQRVLFFSDHTIRRVPVHDHVMQICACS